MFRFVQMKKTDYQARVAHQVAQYATAEIHQVTPIYDYWSDTHLRPRLNSVLGVDTIPGFYVDHIRQRVASNADPQPRILSIGAGDAELEVQIAQQLVEGGLRTFRLEGLELSPILIDRANQRIAEAGLAGYVTVIPCDLNSWSQPESSGSPYAAVLANHILHHVVELEALFATVALAIGDTGVFLTADMIGRNGHMRWPEALTLVQALWDTLPDELKYNRVFLETDFDFRNWDCLCHGGFEGIRSQDILPLLVERFHFEKFLGFGGVIEVFCDRCYGPNFDRTIPAHTRFIDSVEQLNSLLLQLGVVKPTMMFAVMSNRQAASPRFWKNLSPQFSVRDPGDLDLSPHRQKSQALANARKPDILTFRKGGEGERALRSGWSYPEDWGTWMQGPEATVEIALPANDKVDLNNAKADLKLILTMRASAFVPRRLYSRSFSFTVGGVVIGRVTFFQGEKHPRRIALEMDAPAGDSVLLRIEAHEQASPADDGSADHRPLGLFLIDLAIG